MFVDTLKWGFEHILDMNAYDHLLFLVALTAVYRLKEWKTVLILVTAFTIGHSLTLALAGFNILSINPDLVETLIPITIIITAIYNIVFYGKSEKFLFAKYPIALFFGLIHGLGFSNNFRLLMGDDTGIVSLLLPFNLGVELGQIVIVFFCLLAAFLVEKSGFKFKHWVYLLSTIAIFVSVKLLIA
jgi:hypothetical protein